MNLFKKLNILNRNNIIIIFFLFLVINYAFFNYRILFRENGYILGDWLINYSGGFIKRGFIGHLFYLFSKSFSISIIHTIYFFSTTIYLFSIYFFYQIIKKRLNNNLILLFVFLPSTFLFNFFDPLTVGRKEILVFFFFSFYYLNIDKIRINFNYQILIFFMSVIFLLTHEIIFFLFPYLFVLKYFHINKDFLEKFKIKDYYLEILIAISGFILIVIILFFSHNHNHEILCNSVLNVGLTTDVCYGSINDFKKMMLDYFVVKTDSKIDYISLYPYFIQRNYFINYSFYFLMSILPLILIIFYSNKNTQKTKFIFLSIFCLIFSLSFFGQVNDWGRYLNVIFLLQFLIILKFTETNVGKIKTGFKINKFIKVVILFIYLTSWHMPHCCNPNLGKGYYDIYNRFIVRLYDNTQNSTKFQDKPRMFLRKLFKID